MRRTSGLSNAAENPLAAERLAASGLLANQDSTSQQDSGLSTHADEVPTAEVVLTASESLVNMRISDKKHFQSFAFSRKY